MISGRVLDYIYLAWSDSKMISGGVLYSNRSLKSKRDLRFRGYVSVYSLEDREF